MILLRVGQWGTESSSAASHVASQGTMASNLDADSDAQLSDEDVNKRMFTNGSLTCTRAITRWYLGIKKVM